jgi:subtilase family serine protease/RNA polymerase subunit RPABC4/transcription elongation factor Spt4/ribosomal protein L40E
LVLGTGYANQTIVVTSGSWTLDGNLTIRAGGVVKMINSTMIFRSDYSGSKPVGAGIKALTLTIEDGGVLILDNSTLTVDVLGGNPIPALGVVIRHGGYLESRTSTISFSGHLLVDDAKFDLIDSTVSGVKTVYNSTYFPAQVFSSSPVMLFMSSNVTMIGSTVLDMYDNGTYNTVTSAPYNNTYQFAKDDGGRQFVDYYLERDVNNAFGAGTSPAIILGQQAQWMTMNDTKYLTIAPNQKLNTTGFDMAGLVFESTDIVSATLHVSYLTDTTFTTGGHLNAFYDTPQFGTTGATPITITPTYQAYNPSGTNVTLTKSYTLPAMSAQSLGKLALNFTNAGTSNVYIDRIWLTIDMRLSTYRNITLGGSTNLIVADSNIPLNNINENNGTNAASGAYHKLVVLDQSIANLYGLTVQNSTGGYYGTNVFKTKNLAKVITANGTTGVAGQDASGLYAAGDFRFYDVAPGQTMNIVSYNLGELTGSIKSLTVSFVYITTGAPSTNYIQYSVGGSALKNTNMQLSNVGTSTTIGPFDLYANGVDSISKLKTLTLSYTNTGGAGTVRFDRMYLNITTQPQAAIYRWSLLNVTDGQSVPVGNVGVSSSIIGTGVPAYYLDQAGVVATPPQAILNYLGKTGSNFNRTSSNGFVKLPLLTDVLNSSNLRNGKAFDYNLVFMYRDADGLYELNNSNGGGISTNFTHFPNMVKNTDARNVMFPTLSVVFGPIILSGTDTMTISGSGLYQVKGDIIIEDNAQLIITSGTLKILDSYPGQFKITVSGSGSIEIKSGTITSTASMQIFLTDNAVLSATNGSSLAASINVNIDGQSKVKLADDDSVAANFTAPTSSNGNLTATNVTFLNKMTFGGNATAVLTNVSLPAIVLQDTAKAWNYRWLTITVMDGTTVHGISNAFVQVDWSTGTLYAKAKTGANGTATFRILSDTIVAGGYAAHVGNYLVNATYWYKGQAYQSTGNITGRYTQVGTDPTNGTQITQSDVGINVIIPGALPELDPPFWASTYHPARGVVVALTSNVTNVGVVTAYNVLVRFTDVTTGAIIANRTIQSIAPGAYSNITVQWTAIYPVGNHTLNVTVDPLREIPQLDRSNNWNETTVTVLGVPDLSIVPAEISINPLEPVTNSTVSITAYVKNSGDNMDQSVVISFYDVFHSLNTLIGNFTLPAIRSGQTGVALMTWQNMLPGDHNITVVIDKQNLILEASKSNNQASIDVTVLDYPDLVATNLQFQTSSGSVITQAFVGSSVTLSATVMNTGESVATNFLVRFWLGTTSTGTKIGDVLVPSLDSGATINIQTTWNASLVQGSGRNQSRMITVEVNPFTHGSDMPITETSYANNIITGSLLVIDNRADLWFPNGVSVKPFGSVNTTTSAVQGQKLNISFTIANQGLKPASEAVLDIYVKDSDNFTHYLMSTTENLAGGASVQISFPWVVNVTAGVYTLVVEMNSRHVIEESNYTNNIDSRNFTINLPNPLILINIGSKTDFQPGDSIFVTGTITNTDGNYPLANQSVTIRLLDSGGLPVGQPVNTNTDGAGAYSGGLFIPTDLSGQHSVSVTLNTGATYSESTPINIVQIFKPQSVPFWIFILIAVIVLAVILVFSVYLYKFGLGKMVECGECGSLIPESSKRCPRCGTEFETETAKCSECGTWIPAKAKECPECGAKFMTEPMEEISEDDYMTSMRRQYEEYINGFRDQAKAALGKKYSEDKFMDWLKTEPAYMTFEVWLAKQEEERKIGSVPCPSCGTLNPKGATICSKCGTVFDRAETQTGGAGEQKPFRKIVKRSSERKMIPKKVVKEDQTGQPVEQQAPEEPKKE